MPILWICIMFHILAILLSSAAVFSFINHRYFRLPRTIALMLFALVFSFALILLGELDFALHPEAVAVVKQIDFERFLLQGILGFLLFAGALHVEVNRLFQHKWMIFSLAIAGTLISTFLVAGFAYMVFIAVSAPVPFIFCLLFGALISPTDPIAVMGILKELNASKSIETQMAGESLFNDGVGVVLFVALLDMAFQTHETSVAILAGLFAKEALGGVIYGLLLGKAAYEMLKRVDDPQVEVLITLGLVMGGYDLAHSLGVSGPLAMVAAGLLIGNQGRAFAMSEKTRVNLDAFWELTDGILNAVLFILMGLEVLILDIQPIYLLAGSAMIPLVLFARLISVGLTFGVLKKKIPFGGNPVKILTWGGLRGGIAVALALSIPPCPYRDLLLVATYLVVVFSILVQGLSMKRLLKKWKVS